MYFFLFGNEEKQISLNHLYELDFSLLQFYLTEMWMMGRFL